MAVWRGPKGIEVEAIILNSTPTLRATQRFDDRAVLLGHCRSVADLKKLGIELADLEEGDAATSPAP
ncbi:hypothetical protein ACIBHY_29775 [Nonomuraea sp. NPDC050547]|uniref:hypothetical protein n=1 Tax=Nonomuraea sp. NPDC050547 TaxID=3364368 RepID=UPI0037895D97